ncbi:hypothetical protein Glove_140g81 [Diversispora epigaea]|uniref:Uncharacterized protein n=1 Tax=Diversispora epigaea TaxID=1348612 RepID=A0A397IV31_9GLOM|nr:hypothetical protein Glove_140g81 [Diversispora epigaea]
MVADCYYNGFGIEKNKEKSFETCLESAEKGSLTAQSNVGANGIGIMKDEAKGFQWNKKTALNGNDAMCNVGCYYDNEKETFKWYLKAAKIGSSMAQHNLGDCYSNGEGSSERYKKAAENNNTDSQYWLGRFFY